MAISWSSVNGHMRVGIDVTFSSVNSASTTVDVTVDYWIENTQWFNDNQTLKWDNGNGNDNTHNFLNDYSAGQYKIKTHTRDNLPISYSGGPTYTATAEITGAYDGSNPSRSRNYTLPARPAAVPGAPGGPFITSVTNNSAYVYVTAAASNGSTIDQYQIEIATNTGFTTGYQLANNSGQTFGGLAAATTYYTRSRAHNGIGWGPYTTTKSFTTGATVPGAPTGVGNNTVSQSTVNITWTAPASNGGSAITGYQIQRATDSGFTANVVTVDDPDDVSPYAMSGLNPATTYWARVRALNGVGAGAWSSATSFTTLTGTPSIVTPSEGVVSNRGWPYVVVSATGIQATSTITAEIGKDSAFASVAMTTNLSTDLITRSDAGVHGLVENDVVFFTAVTTAAPLAINTPYYVSATGLTTTAFRVAATPGGTPLDLTQTGTATMVRYHTLTLTPGSASGNNQYILEDTAKLINNGTWYARARVTTTAISYTTPNSDLRTYTVSHTPSALLNSPASGTTAKWTASTNFTFTFSDANAQDKISAFQLVIEDNATGGDVGAGGYLSDSGKVAQAGTSNTQSFVRTVAIPDTQKGQVLRWRVRVWDRNNQVSAYTGYSTLTLVDAPLVSVTSPANGSTVGSGTPTISWTFTAPSGGTQASALVEVRDSTTNTVVWSTTVIGTATTVTPPIVILQNGNSYTVTVTATDTYNLSTSASSSFSAVYSAPSALVYSFDETEADEYGYVDVDWTDAAADSLFVSWKVYRKATSDSTDTWELVFETTDQNVRHYFDYLLIPGDTYSYSVTQTAFRSGSILESPVGYYLDALENVLEEDRFGTPDISHYWIVDPVTNQNSVRLENVTADDSTLEFESSTYSIIGRGRHRDYGDELGYSGSITCQVRGVDRSSLFRSKMETLRRNQETYYLRTPFGRLFPIAIGDLGWSPLSGTGISEMGEMTIPYEEVS